MEVVLELFGFKKEIKLFPSSFWLSIEQNLLFLIMDLRRAVEVDDVVITPYLHRHHTSTYTQMVYGILYMSLCFSLSEPRCRSPH